MLHSIVVMIDLLVSLFTSSILTSPQTPHRTNEASWMSGETSPLILQQLLSGMFYLTKKCNTLFSCKSLK